MKKFVKASLQFSSAILAIAITVTVIVFSAIWAYNLGIEWVAISFLTFLVAGALLGLLISYRMLLGKKTAIMHENATLSTRLKLSWDNNTFLQEKIGRLKNTLREYETLIRDMNKAKLSSLQETADLENTLTKSLEEKANLSLKVTQLTAKLDAERAARIEDSARSGQKAMHLDQLRVRHIEHLQKVRKAKKALNTKVEVLEDELGLLRLMGEEYWRLKNTYEPQPKTGIAAMLSANVTLVSIPELLRKEEIAGKEFLKEAV